MEQNYTVRFDLQNMNAVADFMVRKNEVFKSSAPNPEVRALADLQKSVYTAIGKKTLEELRHNGLAGVCYTVEGHSGVLLHMHVTENKKSINSSLVTMGDQDSIRFQTEKRTSVFLDAGIEFEPVFYIHPGRFFNGELTRLSF